jgi:hypothetical protein
LLRPHLGNQMAGKGRGRSDSAGAEARDGADRPGRRTAAWRPDPCRPLE